MANQTRAGGDDLWFVTADGADKLRDIAHDPHVNLAYPKAGSRASGSSPARLTS
jgi:general stress protein 26